MKSACWGLACSFAFLSTHFAFAQVNHRLVQKVNDANLSQVVALQATADGEFLYSASFGPGVLNAFRRNAETGELEKFQSLGGSKENAIDLKGIIGLSMSADGAWLVGSSYNTERVFLFPRNPEDGALTKVSEIKNGVEGAKGLSFPIELEMSPDGNFVYVANAKGTLTVLKRVDDTLQFLHMHEGLPELMKGGRAICFDPTFTFLFVCCQDSNSVGTFDRDSDLGHVRVLSYIEDGKDGAVLAGATRAICSVDGKFLYVASGRFRGDEELSVFSMNENGELTLVQEIESSKTLTLSGANGLAVSPDGTRVYLSCAKSNNAICFKRDTENGTLDLEESLRFENRTNLGVVAGIYVSPDSRFVYVCGEGQKCIYVFERVE